MTEPSLNRRYKSTEEAINPLENPVPREENSLSKQKLDKPVGSEIQFYKNIDNLEIIIPPQGFRIIQIALISLASPFVLGFFLTKLTIGNKLPQRNILLDNYSQKFFLSKYANFTAEELEWLEQEMSDYLEIPIDRFDSCDKS